MLTWAVAFLLVAIFAAVFGFIAAGPIGLIVFGVFFALFLWAMMKDRADRHR